jgi:hypothetical protein
MRDTMPTRDQYWSEDKHQERIVPSRSYAAYSSMSTENVGDAKLAVACKTSGCIPKLLASRHSRADTSE